MFGPVDPGPFVGLEYSKVSLVAEVFTVGGQYVASLPPGEGNFLMHSRFRLVTLCIAAVIVIAISWGAWWWHYADIRTNVILREATAEFVRDATANIARGMTKAQVEKYLEARNMVFASRELYHSEVSPHALSRIEARTTQEIRVPIGTCFIVSSAQILILTSAINCWTLTTRPRARASYSALILLAVSSCAAVHPLQI